MNKFIFLILGLTFLLSGCQTETQTVGLEEKSHKMFYYNDQLKYQISFPPLITESGSWMNSITNTKGLFFGSSIDRSIDPPFGRRDVSVEIHHLKSPSCIPSITGTPQLQKLSDGEIKWGKTKAVSPFTQLPHPICQPPILNTEDYDILRTGDVKYGTAYVLCSEKNSDAIVVCISQVTDNPALAEQIFSTFKWTE